jgi:pyrimidine-specific ribonucleoside hydrolase
MYGLDLFGRLVIDEADADLFRVHDHPAIRLAGELLYRRRVSSDDSTRDYLCMLGDAGAMVLLTNPELFVISEFPVRVNLAGIGRGQTIVDQRASHRGTGHDPDPWPRIVVAVDLDAAQAALTFVKVIDSYAA